MRGCGIPFDYKAELRKARGALDAKVGAYVSENPTLGYREIASAFHLSPAAICAIAKGYSRHRKRGRVRRADKRVTFFVRYLVKGTEFRTNVTVIAPKGTTTSRMRSAVERYFDWREVKIGSSPKAEAHAEYLLNELNRSEPAMG